MLLYTYCPDAGTYLVLSIDGGGFKGFACLLILDHLMKQISGGNDEDIPKPCQIFDLICGTSTGGLIAILLGRFGLSCDEAIEVYRKVAATMFDGETDSGKIWKQIIEGGQLSSAKFEKELEDLAEKYTGSKDALFRPLTNAPDTVVHDSTKTFVTVVSKIGAAGADAYRIRSYPRPLRDIDPAPYGHKWTVCEGARATCATTLYMSPLKIRSGHATFTFQDAGYSGFNNPAKVALDEAEKIFGVDAAIALVSLGTGLRSLVDGEAEDEHINSFTQQILARIEELGRNVQDAPQVAKRVVKQLLEVANDTEISHSHMSERFKRQGQQENYSRFNPTRGLGDIDLTDYTREDAILETTYAWLRSDGQSTVASAIQNMKESEELAGRDGVEEPTVTQANSPPLADSTRTAEHTSNGLHNQASVSQDV
ncbi:acyl transferase/acyl hydrolase/lysophospholipase [Boletus edulis]|nr:acyl transferase/acyl hydrolase/lysophospholipase [Boletus edulis]